MKLQRVSASQVDAFKRCQRYWYFGWVMKIKPPPTEAMQRGTDIHKEIENYLLTGRIRKHPYAPYVRSAAELLPDPTKAKELLVEQEIEIPCPNGVTWIGYIDVLHCDREPLLVIDTKTTSDFRYAKTPHQLKNNTQLNSYGKFVYHMGHTGPVTLAHLYIKTTKKRVPKKPKTKFVDVITSKNHVDEMWGRDMEVVGQMAHVAACVKSPHDLPPTTSACGMYGGCPHRNECSPTLSQFMQLGKRKKGTGPMSSLLERLKKSKKGGGAKGTNGTNGKSKATEVPEVKDKPEGVLAEDAPSRETETETDKAEAKETESKGKGKKKTTTKKKSSAKKKKAKKADTETGLCLYIDCTPVKDVNGEGIEPTLFEDWIGPVVHDLNAEVQESEDLPDYRLLPYAQEKAAFQAAVESQVGKNLPKAMVISTGTPGSKEALAVLVPHAERVVRAIR